MMEPTAMPEKLNNNGSIATVEEVEVMMNAFRVDVSRAKAKVYKFELKFVKTAQRPGRDGAVENAEMDLSRGVPNDFARQAKRRLLWECYQKLLGDNPDFFGGDARQHCYDCGINLYSLLQLRCQPGATRAFPIAWAALSLESRMYLGLRRTVAVRAELKVPGMGEQHELELRDAHFNVEDRSVEQCVDVLTTEEMHERDSHHHYPQSKYFERDVNAEIHLRDEAKVLKPGLAKNVRFVGKDAADSRLIVQVEPRKTSFFPAVSVIDFLSALLPGVGPTMPLSERMGMGNAFEVASHQLKGLVVLTTHRHDSFPLHGLSEASARNQQFRQRDGTVISIENYFLQHHQIRLNQPHLQCGVQKKPQQDGSIEESYHPLELLKIAPGQRVPIEKQTPTLTEKMLNACQIAPEAYMQRVGEARESAFITPMANNPSFRAFEVDVNLNPAKVKAQLLYPPAVEFNADGTDREEVHDGLLKWGRLGDSGRRFLSPAQASPWAAILFGGCLAENEFGAFLEQFTQEAKRRGIALGPPQFRDPINITDINYLRAGFKETYKANKVHYVIFFTKDKLDPVHDTMKELEREFTIVTQHVSAGTAMRVLDKSRGAHQMIIDNLLLKFNLKMGGVNYGLATSGEYRAVSARSRSPVRDVVKDAWLEPGRMFFGIDLSHASAQSRFQRVRNEPVSEPTVVGCAYTLGHPLLMRGAYWYQESRLTHVARPRLAVQIEEALGNYRTKMGRFPHHVFVYRAGVSEGEFAAVVEQEKNAFGDAFNVLAGKLGAAFTRPRLTVIVAQQRSSYRMVPTTQVADKWRQQEERIAATTAKKPSPSGSPVKAFNGNVRPGTVVDHRIMHPTLTEFLLVGHRAIKGTARPIRCTVVWDDYDDSSGGARVSLQELENVTNALCYAHGIVCSPVSLPAPLYAASELAKRGRNNWKVRRGEDDERMRRDEGVAGIFHLQREQMDQPDNFFGRMSDDMRARIPTKFWA